MNYKKLTKVQAKIFADDIDALSEAAFLDLEAKWQKNSVDDFDPAYSDLRSKVLAVYQESKPNGGYAIDVNIGLCLYTELSVATVYKGNIIKNLIMDCQSYTKYRPNETMGGIFVSWRRKEELPTGA